METKFITSFICPYTEPDHSSLSIPLLLSNFSNQTKQRQRTLIKYPGVNFLKIFSLTPVHYMQTEGRNKIWRSIVANSNCKFIKQ